MSSSGVPPPAVSTRQFKYGKMPPHALWQGWRRMILRVGLYWENAGTTQIIQHLTEQSTQVKAVECDHEASFRVTRSNQWAVSYTHLTLPTKA